MQNLTRAFLCLLLLSWQGCTDDAVQTPASSGAGAGGSSASHAISPGVLASLGLTLPASASNTCYEERSLMVRWQYLRFDILAEDVDAIQLADGPLPSQASMSEDYAVLGRMQAEGSDVDWWRPIDLESPLCASSTSVSEHSGSSWERRCSIAIGAAEPDKRRVYVLVSEEPV